MSRQVLTTAQIRQVDRRAIEHFGMNSLVLMENAANHCVQWIRQHYTPDLKTLILCGSGNNGGDGLVIARHLQTYGWDCQCMVTGPLEKLSHDARHNAEILLKDADGVIQLIEKTQTAPVAAAIENAQLIIDAMLGTGASGIPREPIATWIELANASPAHKLAIDLPSGVQADTGQTFAPCFRTDATLTFVALKPSMTLPAAKQIFGTIDVLPIGIPIQQIHELLFSQESGH